MLNLILGLLVLAGARGVPNPPQTPVPPATPTLQPLSTINLQCKASGASNLAHYQWQKMDGPADVPFSDATMPNTQASFISPGTYRVRCVVSETGKMTTWGDWSLVVGANFVPETPPTSTIKIVVDQIPPPEVTDKLVPSIDKVMFGALQISKAQVVDGRSSAGLVGFNITASDNVGVQTAQLLIDNNRLYSAGALGKLPSSFNLWWMDNPAPAGLHDVMIRVYDSVGNYSEFAFKLQR